MDQVILFDKSLQQRLQEYLDVLGGKNVLPVSEIKKAWSFFLELELEPKGWQAIWKIPRVTCELYKIPFPTIVLVYVDDTFYDELEAVIKILAVQDDISLPNEHLVALIELWPTKTQDTSIVLDMRSTANSLDMLRFFYNNLIMPWDYEDDDTSDWLSRHLETRLRLYYDLKNGLIPHVVSEHIRKLLVESRRLQVKRQKLEKEIGDDDDIEVSANTTTNIKLQTLMEIHVRLIQIKSEVEILENPLMRNVILKQQDELTPKKGEMATKFWLMCNASKVNEYVTFLKQVEQYYPNETFKFASNLSSTLEEISFTDVIILSKSKHTLKAVGKLDYGGIIKGVYEKEDTIIESQSEDVMFDITEEVVIENLTIEAGKAQCGMVVRRGKLILKNCILVGNTDSSTHQGIIVIDGSQLDIMDCDISGFATAIVGNSGSQITIKNCKIHDVNFGLKVYDNCLVSVQNSTFTKCREYGICVETDTVTDGIEVGSFDVLKTVPDINVVEVNGINNGKGDVIINNGQKIIPLRDLFTNLDLTYSNRVKPFSQDDTMEVTDEDINNTVIEIRD